MLLVHQWILFGTRVKVLVRKSFELKLILRLPALYGGFALCHRPIGKHTGKGPRPCGREEKVSSCVYFV